ncbi:MAG: PKD domain-containing protein [Bacteroidota bacterium]
MKLNLLPKTRTIKGLIKYLAVLWSCILISTGAYSQVSYTVDTATGCSPLTVTFTNTSAIGDVYWWEFDDGSDTSSVNVVHTFYSAGEYRVRLHAFDFMWNYLGSYEMEILVLGLGGFWSSADQSGDSVCVNGEIMFDFSGAGDSILWDFDDGEFSTEENPAHSYSSAGTYSVQLFVYSICGVDSITDLIYVTNNANPSAQFGFFPDTMCPGDAFSFEYWGWSISTDTYVWDFGDGEIDSSNQSWGVMHAYDNTGAYPVTLTVTNICGNQSSYTNTVTVSNSVSLPNMTLVYLPACPGDEMLFAIQGGAQSYDYQWNFAGDLDSGATSGDGDAVMKYHTFSTIGNYNVSVLITNGCGDTTTLTTVANVQGNLFPDFENTMFGMPSEGGESPCPGDSVLFFVVGDVNAFWDFGDGDTSSMTSLLYVQEAGGPVTVIRHAYDSVGTYWAKLTLTNGCGNSATDSVQVTIDTGAVAVAEFASSSPANGMYYETCESIEFFAIGGVSYFWDFGDGETLATTDFTVLHTYSDAGNYYVSMTVTNGCGNNATGTVMISIEGPVINKSNITCNGSTNGTATVIPSGGSAPYTYSWDDPASQTTATATGLSAGTYTVSVIESGGCTSTSSAIITEPAANTLTLTSVNSSCGSSDGEASVTVSGGLSPYTYKWDDPGSQTTITATGLPAGTYTVSVTDANGCEVDGTISVNDAGAPTVSISSYSGVSCNGGSDGSATVLATGGATPYTYSWDDPGSQATAAATGLAGGTYFATVTDNAGCSASASVTITAPPSLVVSLVSVDSISVNGGNDGIATVSATGGTGALTYLWDDPSSQTTAAASNLIAGTYVVTVTDGNGCEATLSVTVYEPPVGISEISKDIAIDIYPNPNNGNFNLIMTGISEKNGVITILNTLGQVILTDDLPGLNSMSGRIIKEVTLPGIPTGIYIIELSAGNKLIHKRMVIH